MRSVIICTKLATLEPSGYITAANVNDFQEMLTKAVKSPDYSGYLVDMHKVEFLDSAGLMVLVCAFRLAQSLGKRFSVCSLAPSVRIIFELTQLDRVVEIFESRAIYDLESNQELAA